MAAMEYDLAAAERLEAVYLGPDMVAQREDTLRRLAITPGERILDIGSGPGFLADAMSARTGPQGVVAGVDISAQMVARASDRNTREWLAYNVADATALPFADAHFDVVVSTQVAEYIADTDAFCAEVVRVLKPGGRALILATDWDAVCWHSSDPTRMERVLDAFRPHCAHVSLPRTLALHLHKAGLVLRDVSYFPIINLDRRAGCYSEMIPPFITAYIRKIGTLPESELEAWSEDLDELNRRGAHFFSSGRFSFLVDKPEGA